MRVQFNYVKVPMLTRNKRSHRVTSRRTRAWVGMMKEVKQAALHDGDVELQFYSETGDTNVYAKGFIIYSK